MQNNAKIPFWIQPDELQELTVVIGNLLDSHQVQDSEKSLAMEIHHELGVAFTRFEHARIPSGRLQQVLNVSESALPVHFSADEVAFLQSLSLSKNLQDHLNE